MPRIVYSVLFVCFSALIRALVSVNLKIMTASTAGGEMKREILKGSEMVSLFGECFGRVNSESMRCLQI